MIVYRFRRGDRVFDGVVEVPDGPTIPPFHTRVKPPEKEGFYAVMQKGWVLVEGTTPPEPAPMPEPIPEIVIEPEPNYADIVRKDRDRRLSETDWIVVKSYEFGISVPEIWRNYRQILRDVPQQEGFPHEVIWPEKPE